MVSTRSHPTAFPPPDLTSPTKSPSKRGGGRSSRATSTASPAPGGNAALAPPPTSAPAPPPTSAPGISTASNAALLSTTNKPPNSTTSPPRLWTHTPSRLTLAWLALSLPLVAWDTGYVLLRPHSMPGGRLHWPVWQPYALYGTIDHVYGFPAWEAGDGFGAAQATLNAVETALYAAYLGVVWAAGAGAGGSAAGVGAGAGGKGEVGVGKGEKAAARVVVGRRAAQAVLVAFAASVMTLSKTVLYWLNEYWNGFHNIGHNDAASLFFLWIVPNGAWLILPTYMIYVFGSEIIQGLEAAGSAAASVKKSQ
ncbi:c6 transcription factor [Diplodia corticola]|uniref:C6 transcription factor n=1 Tax=Diplodia corticola TaxID=236234 RepID=A0A1J9QKZ7_9PEZI|nr:c6 transcription factor [Diplodia corticola]OJD29137.1 c6 transcription factor [Diplodia corticola]